MDKQRLQQLIDKVLSGRATAQEQEELDQWYAAQDGKEGLTEQLDETHKSAYGKKLFQVIEQQVQEAQWQPESMASFPNTAPRKNNTTWIAAAAVLLLIAGGAIYFLLGNKPAATAQAMVAVWKQEATTTAIKKVSLPDGSAVWLNAASSLRYDTNFTSGKREVWLEGEAFFDVAHQENKSFEVHAGQYTTRVLGTAFNIDAYKPNDSVIVTVTRGKVRVADSTKESGLLLRDEKLTCKPVGDWSKDIAVKADENMAWTSGQLFFREMKFKEVASRLERRFGIELVFKNKGIENCPITATFHDDTPVKEILEILAVVNGSIITQGDSPYKYTISGNKTCK